VAVTAPDGSFIPFACETEPVNEPPAPPNNTRERRQITAMKMILANFPSKLIRSSAVESRVIFWNLLFTMALSSLLLLLYLKKILFDL
jgi:hypothetical protein